MSGPPLEVAQPDGRLVAYDRDGTGQPLVLLHGAQSARGQFAALRHALGGEIATIAYDQRDVGVGADHGEPYDMCDLADDFADFLDVLEIDRADVLGTSFGGALALTIALRHPGRVRHLVLVGATPSWGLVHPPSPLPEGAGVADRLEALVAHMVTPTWRDAHPEVLEVVAGLVGAVGEDGAARRMAALRTHDVTDRLAEIAAPTLVVHGDHDVLIPVDVARLVAAAIPNAELEVLEDVAHAIDLEAPERLASLVRGFLAGDSEEA